MMAASCQGPPVFHLLSAMGSCPQLDKGSRVPNDTLQLASLEP
jgi:hypothetical protein